MINADCFRYSVIFRIKNLGPPYNKYRQKFIFHSILLIEGSLELVDLRLYGKNNFWLLGLFTTSPGLLKFDIQFLKFSGL